MMGNKIYNEDCLDTMARIEPKSINLIIADPPYFEVKGEFDFIWNGFADYLKDVGKWAIECKRILAENGTLLWFGNSKKIAYSQIIFDKYFGLVNSLVWEKAEADGLFGSSGSELLRSFPNSTERVLMYSNEGVGDDLDENYDHYSLLQRVKIMKPLIEYMNGERKKSGLSIKEINDKTDTKMGSIWFTHPSQWQLATKEWYLKLRGVMGNGSLQREYSDLRNKYEELSREYEGLRRPFNNLTNSTEVLKFRFKPSEYEHETVKPELLARTLILTCSRKNDLLYIPFVGSGTECAMAIKEGRRFIGSEISAEYCEIAMKRINAERSKIDMFK